MAAVAAHAARRGAQNAALTAAAQRRQAHFLPIECQLPQPHVLVAPASYSLDA
jgi:hypothetical protein